uniref:Uncharacterized protein LOC111115853 n=1 Tax=Crassostrea virginica TaxID=6565 RepID=A0A8B8C4D2_CRAVI|nr:uncharacterized protein LOC111115853 [Crassostrea virginica]
MALWVFRWAILLSLAGFGCSFDVFNKNETDFVDNMVQKVMACKNIPGLSLTIIRGAQNYVKAYGNARLDPSLSFTTKTPIYLVSSGWAYTSALLGILMTKTKSFGWDTKLSEILGKNFDLSDKSLRSEMTIKDLLSHRTGLSEGDIYTGVPKIGRAEYVKRLRYLQKVGSFRNSWIFNNLLYAIAGHVAEVKQGGRYEDIMTNEMLKPLGMFQAVCGSEIYPNSSQTTHALPYQIKGGKLTVGNPLIYQIGDLGPAGCISASGEDLYKLLRFMISGGKTADGYPLISPEVFKEITEPQANLDNWSINRFHLDQDYPVNASGTWYGLGWYGGYYRGHKKVFHPGNWYGYSSAVGFFPGKYAGFGISINGPWPSNYRTYLAPLSYALSDLVLGEKQWLNDTTVCTFPAPWKNPITSSNITQPNRSPVTKATQYVGDYGHRIFGTMKIREVESGKLSFEMNTAGFGNLTVASLASHSFKMAFNYLLDDVAGSSCDLKFESISDGIFQKVKVNCFYSDYHYSRGVDFASPEPLNSAGQVPEYSTLLYCVLGLFFFLRK